MGPAARLAGVAALAALLLAGCGDAGDQAVLDELLAAGADLSQPREVRYYLYVGEREQADQVAAELSASGRSITVEPSAAGTDWLVLVTEQAVVDADTLAARRAEFEERSARWAVSTTAGRPRSNRDVRHNATATGGT